MFLTTENSLKYYWLNQYNRQQNQQLDQQLDQQLASVNKLHLNSISLKLQY